MKTLALIGLLILGGCASAPPTNSVIVKCGQNSVWSSADQDKLADALEPPTVDPIILRLELDWQGMRDVNAACSAASSVNKQKQGVQ